MRKLLILVLVIVACIAGSCSSLTDTEYGDGNETDPLTILPPPAHTTHQGVGTGHWVTAYLASYMHQDGNLGNMPTNAIDWSAFTHLIYFALQARPDGSLGGLGPGQNMTPAGVREIVSAGHENGVPVLICIGGWGNYNGFSQAIQPGSRSNFVNNIVNTVIEWGFDGVDVNMEPIEPSDHENYAAFVNELYDRLQTLETPILPRPIMTAAVHWEPELISRVQNRFDQINIMSYNLCGAFTDWVTWHNSPLENGGYNFLVSILGCLWNCGIYRFLNRHNLYLCFRLLVFIRVLFSIGTLIVRNYWICFLLFILFFLNSI
jgi:GH18 family chitinase